MLMLQQFTLCFQHLLALLTWFRDSIYLSALCLEMLKVQSNLLFSLQHQMVLLFWTATHKTQSSWFSIPAMALLHRSFLLLALRVEPELMLELDECEMEGRRTRDTE